ncbi:hypothetical protein DV736_g4686, partial [Chaetothyriales sp. CBS 134916]
MTPGAGSPEASERTPLLSQPDTGSQITQLANGSLSPRADSLQHDTISKNKKQSRRPTLIALTVLCLVAVLICIGFTIPPITEQYVAQALVLQPDNLSIDSFTAFGVTTRMRGAFYLNGSKVLNKPIRDLGRAFTWIAREVESGQFTVDVILPEYDNVLVATAMVPSIKVNIRDQHHNHLDVLADVVPGDVDGITRVTKDFLDRHLDRLSILAVANVPLRSGFISIGTQTVRELLTLEGHDFPAMPSFNISELRLAEYGLPGHPEGVKAKAVVSMAIDYSVELEILPLAFEVLVPDCSNDYLVVATARTDLIHVMPKKPLDVAVTALIHQLPTSLTKACPGSTDSPLDKLVREYLAGRDATVYIRGGNQDSHTPDWLANLLHDTTIPFSVPGHPFDNLIKEFSLTDTHFSLPDPSAEDGHPTVSTLVKVLVGLPEEINVDLDVDRVRADTDVFYKGTKFGVLNLKKWQAANATKVDDGLLIQAVVNEAPLEVTDFEVFSQVVQKLVWGHDGVQLDIRAVVDASTVTALGQFVVRNIPAKGKIFVNPLERDTFQPPTISNMSIYDSTVDSLVLQAIANITNPTEYSAHLPYVNVSVIVNDTLVGYAWASADIVPGPNQIVVHVSFDHTASGQRWLSQFISGQNTNLTIRTHEGSVRGIPDVSLEVTFQTPRLLGKFLKEATMHIMSSTAVFILSSPFALSITSILASASHDGTEIGSIDYPYPFDILSGENETPRLPVKWAYDGGTVRDALGGTLKLDAVANVSIRIGLWEEVVRYEGHGIGAKIRL